MHSLWLIPVVAIFGVLRAVNPRKPAMEDWTVVPFEKFGPIQFGMTRDEVRALLGPDCMPVREKHTLGIRGLREVSPASGISVSFDDADTARAVDAQAPRRIILNGKAITAGDLVAAKTELEKLGNVATETPIGWGFEGVGLTLNGPKDIWPESVGACTRDDIERFAKEWKRAAERKARGLTPPKFNWAKSGDNPKPPPRPKYTVNLASFSEHVPPEVKFPRLLKEFSEWAASRPVASVGDFRIETDRWSDKRWGEAFGDLHLHVAPFFRLYEGSRVAFWFPPGKPLESPPIVFLGSEGKQALLAHSLEQFLEQLADANTGVGYLDAKDERDTTDERAVLKDWLEKHAPRPWPAPSPIPNFVTWCKDHQQSLTDFRERDPNRLQIADILRAAFPFPEDQPTPFSQQFVVLCVGQKLQIRHRTPLAPELVTQLEPLIRADRDRRARLVPERGLWWEATIQIGRKSGAYFDCEFYEEPNVSDLDLELTADDYRADLTAFPRSPYWIPEWLRRKLGD